MLKKIKIDQIRFNRRYLRRMAPHMKWVKKLVKYFTEDPSMITIPKVAELHGEYYALTDEEPILACKEMGIKVLVCHVYPCDCEEDIWEVLRNEIWKKFK